MAEGGTLMIPKAFLERMAFRPGLEEALQRPTLPTALRVNPLKPIRLPWALEPIPWCPEGYYVPEGLRPGLHPLHDAGAYYLQEASAMGPVEALDVQPGMRVLDLCAAPGGKSGQIAGKLLHTGFLLSNEIVPARAKLLSRQMERLGVRQGAVTSEHPQHLAEYLGAVFDRVLVDAPCSGEGMFRKDPHAAEEWTAETNAACAQRQSMILDSAAALVKPGGRLVYSTCTFSVLENEDNANAFLQRHPDFQPVSVALPCWEKGLNGETYCARLWPDTAMGEGHFLAVFQRTDGEEDDWHPAEYRPAKAEFWQEVMEGAAPPLLHQGEQWMAMPEELPRLKGLRVERDGIAAGAYTKGVFRPGHSLAMAYPARQVLDMTEEETVQYLAGMELSGQGKGWMTCRYGGLALGWGKASQGKVKNHLPTGLRRAWRKETENESDS